MDKKFKFSEQPTKVKIIYATVLAVLCVTALTIGIISAAHRSKKPTVDEPEANVPTIGDKLPENNEENIPPTTDKEEDKEEEKKPDKLTFVSPVVGEVTKGHSLDTPVFSDTLNEWRVHTGIDIAADEGAEVFAAADGKVSKVYNDPFLGKTVEITHEGNIVTIYSNLGNTSVVVKEGDSVKSGALIGNVGDTSLSELADESHLHFAIKLNGVSVNPLDYISDDSKKHSLGMTEV